MKTQLINFNGTIYAATDPVFPVTERLLRYGDGLFESIRAINGKVMWAAEHYQRLYEGAKLLHLPLAETLSFEQFHDSLHYLLATNGYRHARLRLCLYREGDGFYAPDQNMAGYFIEATPIAEDKYTLNTDGLHIGIYTEQYKTCTALSNFKTNNALIYVLAGWYKNNTQIDECLILNQKGCIAESISSNIFIIKAGKILTPAAHQGCITGIMRKKILELAATQNIPIEEGVITLDDINEADELFLTNASKGIQWVSKFGNRNYTAAVSVHLLQCLNSTIV